MLARTTRSVAPTEAGEQFIARLSRALADVRGALDQIIGLRAQPAGRVRLVTSRVAARMVLAPKLAQFARDYPDVLLELTTTEESRLDLVCAGFDAGIHLGEFVERDMVAVRVSGEQRRATSRRTRNRNRRAIYRSINASTSATALLVSATGSSTKGRKSLSVAVNGSLTWTTWTC